MSDKQWQNAMSDWLDEGVVADWQSGVPSVDETIQQAADSLVVHGLLTDLGKNDKPKDQERIAALMAAVENEDSSSEIRRQRHRFKEPLAFIGATVALAASVLLVLAWFGGEPVSAATMLDRMIEASLQPRDPTYRIRIVEEYPAKRPRNLPPQRWQLQPKENLDGAILHVRGADKYVMIRELANGRQRITGCDGEESWAFREDGTVHVSSDLQRFRGGMPGHKQNLPFVNLHSHLDGLKMGFDLQLIQEDAKLPRLVATKKADVARGLRRVEIWFDRETRTVHRMLLVGLPRAKGGPKSVMLELIEQRDFGPDFFKHTSHHEADRPVKQDERSP